MRLFVALVYLLLCASAGAAERELAPRPVGPAFGLQEPVAIAFNGADEGFVTWTDARSGERAFIYGSPIDADGRLLLRTGIPFIPPYIVWAGDSWAAFGGSTARRISRSGELGQQVELPFGPSGHRTVASNGRSIVVIRPGGQAESIGIMNADLTAFRTISSTQPLIDPQKVVTDGTNYYVFGHTGAYPRATTVSVLKLSSSGEVLEIKPNLTGTLLDAAWTGRDFVVAISPGPIAFRISADLSKYSVPIGFMTAGTFETLAAGRNGEAIAIWAETPGLDRHIYVAYIRADSASPPHLLGTFSFPQRVAETIRAAATSRGYVVVGPDLRSTLVPFEPASRAAMQVWTEEQTVSPAAQYRFAAVRDGRSDLFTFVEQDGASSRVMIGRQRGTTRPLFPSSYPQFSPSIASSGRNALVTWMENRSGELQHTLLATLVNTDGEPLLNSPMTLDLTRHDSMQMWRGFDRHIWPAGVVWTGSMYLVSWYGRVARVLESGFVLDAEPRQIHNHRADHVSMMRVGDVIVSAWMEGDCHPGFVFLPCDGNSLHVARFTLGGEPIETKSIELPSSYGEALPHIAAHGDTAVIVAEPGVLFRVKADGTISAPIEFNREWRNSRPTVARHLDGFLVAWQRPSSHTATTIMAATVSRDSHVSTPFVLATDSPNTQGPQAWTTATGHAAVTYLRVGPHTDWVPRLYTFTFDHTKPTRTRAVRR